MTTVDLSFPLIGSHVPRDHGYFLYAALTTCRPELHRAGWFGVHPIGGQAMGEELLLTKRSEVRLRLPADRIPEVLPLAGAAVRIGTAPVRLGAPVVRALTPAPALDARIVLLKLTKPPRRANDDLGREVLDNDGIAERYQAELERQLAVMNVEANLQLCGRQTITIKGRRLIGYSTRLTGLGPDASIEVQSRGLGGRRALGCGLFRSSKEAG